MTAGIGLLHAYVRDIEKGLAKGIFTERSYYPYLKSLLESAGKGIDATNEPRRIDCGAPDFIVTRGSTTIGYIEAKDVGRNLGEEEQSKQLQRYRGRLSNLMLTDYLEFRWYTNGEFRDKARLGILTRGRKVKRDKDGLGAVEKLLAGFLAHTAEPVGTPKELAQRMAQLAHMVRDLIVAAFEKEPEGGTLHTQFSAFLDNLIPDLSAEQFADMYAQTTAYGLFAARCTIATGKDFSRQNAAYLLPKTNPFLRKLFNHIAGPDLDDRIAWLVDDLAQLLAQADMASILQNFGKRTAKEDPVVHFYETFLVTYDPKVREMRGVYYTPEPVVSYIVRSIDHLLKTHFNKPQGLADANALILDPAVGTATFLYSMVKQLYESLVEQGQKGLWDDYVAEKLLPRLFGFELLMAPYSIAHLKLGLLLRETGYQFGTDQRLGIYLTNTLEEAFKKSELLAGFNEYIIDEANAAAEIKRDRPIMVVLGNPPYSGHSANRGRWAKQLVETYKTVDGNPLGEKNPKWLQDDYVKFIRFGQWRIERTGQGILGFITNHGYLDNPTFRGMRQSLMNTFDEIYVLDLHGNAKKREVAPDGSKDENVFDIQQGVAIGLFVKHPVGQATSPAQVEGQTGASAPPQFAQLVEQTPSAVPSSVPTSAPSSVPETAAKVYHADLWGLRKGKYSALAETDIAVTEWTELHPQSPYYLFVPQQDEWLAEYSQGWKVTDIFPVNSVGIVTARDELAIRWSPQEMWETVWDFASLPPEEAREKYNLVDDVQDWKVSLAQKDIHDSDLRRELVAPVLYRPFDVRYTYYTGHSRGFICRPRPEVMRHMLSRDNLGLVCPRRVETKGPWQHVTCTKYTVEHVAVSLKTIDSLLPLHLYPTDQEVASGLYEADERRVNLNPSFVADLCGKLGVPVPSWSEARTLGEQARVQGKQAGVQGKQAGVQGKQAGVPVLLVGEVVEQSPSTVRDIKVVGPDLAITRRNLPHWQLGGSTYFVTFRVREGITLSPEERGRVLQSCLYGHPRKWHLHAAIVMADHVHLLLTPAEVQPNRWLPLSEIMQGIKSATAHRINKHRGRKGSLWQDESFDRIIRDEAEFDGKWKYICENAAKAELDEDGLGYPFFWWEGKEERETAPEDIFNYAYALFHSPTYRSRYAEFLKIDFPRLPLTSDTGLFSALAEKGADLVSLHLLESPVLDDPRNFVTSYPVSGSNLVEKVSYDGTACRVYINKEQYFEGVKPEVWNFHVGGYQVCQKWLKDRRGRTLSFDDLMHYQKIVVVIRETICLMAEIDSIIPSWPLP